MFMFYLHVNTNFISILCWLNRDMSKMGKWGNGREGDRIGYRPIPYPSINGLFSLLTISRNPTKLPIFLPYTRNAELLILKFLSVFLKLVLKLSSFKLSHDLAYFVGFPVFTGYSSFIYKILSPLPLTPPPPPH